MIPPYPRPGAPISILASRLFETDTPIHLYPDSPEYPFLTEMEARLITDLGAVAMLYAVLPALHMADKIEMNHAIHLAQNIILARPAMRQLYEHSHPKESTP